MSTPASTPWAWRAPWSPTWARAARPRAPRPSPSSWRATSSSPPTARWSARATELVYAVQLEQTYSKQQILGLYLSRVYFGAGAYGIEAAAAALFRQARRAADRPRGGDAGGADEVADRLQSRSNSRSARPSAPAWCSTPWSRPAPSPRRSATRAAGPDAQGLEDRRQRAGAVLRRLAGRPDPPAGRAVPAGPGGRDHAGPADRDGGRRGGARHGRPLRPAGRQPGGAGGAGRPGPGARHGRRRRL